MKTEFDWGEGCAGILAVLAGVVAVLVGVLS